MAEHNSLKEALTIVTEQIKLTEALQESLSKERIALQQQNVDAVESCAATKSALIEQLQRKDDARSQLCLSLGYAAGNEQMQTFIDDCAAGDTLQQAWDTLLRLAETCRDRNNVNGAAIRLRQQHFAANLAVLSGVQLDHDTYTSHGASAAAGESRAIATA